MRQPPAHRLTAARAAGILAGGRRSSVSAAPDVVTARAVFFDVDFTLIYPGPVFQGVGYRDACARYGVTADASAFDRAVSLASSMLEATGDVYDPEIFIQYTRRIIEGMGGAGPGVDRAARDIYDQWAACQHFEMYEDVPDVLRSLHAAGLKIGLISNTQRCLTSFQTHFALEGLFAVAVSSFDHGYMKPHPSIFEAALQQVAVQPHEAVMVGDSLLHDIEGARRLGMRAVLVSRSGRAEDCPPDVPMIRSLHELPPLL
jgi:HAD superfamily hydrolase (TIGR01662 family)